MNYALKEYFRNEAQKEFKNKVGRTNANKVGTGVMSDHVIEITYKKQKMLLRKIGFSVPKAGKHMYFLTNNFQLDARTIADIYKERWKIE